MPLQLLPCDSGVARFVEAGPRTAAGKVPRLAAHLPQRCIDDVWIVRIKRDIDRAGALVLVQDSGPNTPTVEAAKYAAFFVRPERMSKRRDQHNVRVLGVYDHRANVSRIPQPQVLPGAARVDGLVNTVSVRDVAAGAGFAGADVHDIVIRVGDCDCAN